MATENLGRTQTYVAGADLSSHQFGLVMYGTTEGEVIVATAASEAFGILMNNPEDGKLATVLTRPGVKARLRIGAAVTFKDAIESDADGEGITLTRDGDGTTETFLVGYAEEDGGGADEIITIRTVFAPTSK